MKNARTLAVMTVGFFAFANAATADATTSGPIDTPYTQYDPDGVPYAATQPQQTALTPEEISALRKAQEKAAQERDWLLSTYERELQSHSANSKSDKSANLYYQLSTNKELAKLAGLPVIDTDEPEGTVPVPHSSTGPAKLHPGSSSSGLSPYHADLLKPLVTPLGAPEAEGLHNFYSSILPDSVLSPSSNNSTQNSPAPRPEETTDPADIETPGMLAAEKDPLSDASVPDLSLDLLPGETPEQAKEHRDNNNAKLELPLPMNATQLHREQAAAFSPPGAPTAPTAASTTATTTTPTKTEPIVDREAPIPVSKQPQISPVRPAIASPFDILNR